jgi:hypothetical protein
MNMFLSISAIKIMINKLHKKIDKYHYLWTTKLYSKKIKKLHYGI